MNKYKVWIEGHRILGTRFSAELIGAVEAETFAEACYETVGKGIEGYQNFDKEKLTYCGRHLFDNELEARQLYG